jgi:hypothetical protein
MFSNGVDVQKYCIRNPSRNCNLISIIQLHLLLISVNGLSANFLERVQARKLMLLPSYDRQITQDHEMLADAGGTLQLQYYICNKKIASFAHQSTSWPGPGGAEPLQGFN